MSKRDPREFRGDVVRVALARGPGVPLARIAADFAQAHLPGKCCTRSPESLPLTVSPSR